jgi:hypothetical protein
MLQKRRTRHCLWFPLHTVKKSGLKEQLPPSLAHPQGVVVNGHIFPLIMKISSARELSNRLHTPDTFPGEKFPLPPYPLNRLIWMLRKKSKYLAFVGSRTRNSQTPVPWHFHYTTKLSQGR